MLTHLQRRLGALKILVGAAAIALCSAQVLAGQHLHDTPVPQDLCSICSFSDSGSVLAPGGELPKARLPELPSHAREVSHPLITRPFENRLSRAPPLS
ncbi:MAG: hypothetical protein OXU72_06540 [Gammaproteobacteria bacterium]|nr:hypothetical protein [Gammaproteobacteria bacterium]